MKLNFIPTEIKPIPGFKGYFCSNGGLIYSKKMGNTMVIKAYFVPKDGYRTVGLTPTGSTIQKRYKVHRIVASTWLKNPNNLPVVNHKNGFKCDNSVMNLEYVSYTENTQHAFATGLIKNTANIVYKLDKNGQFLEEFKNSKEAGESIGIDKRSICAACTSKKIKRCGGFMWCYKKDYTGEEKQYTHGSAKIVRQYTLDDKFVAEFVSAEVAAKHMGVCSTAMAKACRGMNNCQGYKWKYIQKEEIINKDEVEATDWVILDEYPRYKISPDGRVYSMYQRRILKGIKTTGDRMTMAISTKNGPSKRMYIHRLVALAYIPNPENYPVINHIDGDSLNNNVENLEWCTYAQNAQHAYDTGINSNKKPVIQLDKNDVELARFSSVKEAAKHIGVTEGAIHYVLSGKGTMSKGYKWIRG